MFSLLPPPLFSFFFPPQLMLLFLQLLLWLPLALFLFLLPPLLDEVEPDGPRCPLRDRGSLDLLIHGAGVLRESIATGPITNSDRIPHAPRLGRLGGSLLLLRVRRLDPPR